MYFNGNDAMVLRKISTNSAIDIFGVIGEDPGSAGWDEVTQNHTLVRRPEVTGGDTDAIDAFDVLAVWDSLPANTFDQLGFHTCDCVVSVEETNNAVLKAFPNPFNDQLTITTDAPINMVVVRNLTGALVQRVQGNGALQVRLDLGDLPRGAYTIEARMENGLMARHQAVKH